MDSQPNFVDRIIIREFFIGESTVVTDAKTSIEIGLLDEFKISQEYIPPLAKYGGAISKLQVSISREEQNVTTERTDVNSTVEFTAEVIDTEKGEYQAINLLDSEDGTKHGLTSIQPEYVLEGLTAKGDTYSIVLKIEYDHERTKEVQGYSEEHIKHRREAALDDIEEFQKSV